MTLLTPILIVPAAAGLLCLLLRSRRAMALANVLAFGVTLGLSLQLLPAVLLPPYVVTECDEFFRADALSAWMVLLISRGLAGKRALRRALFPTRPGGAGRDAGPREGVLCADAAV